MKINEISLPFHNSTSGPPIIKDGTKKRLAEMKKFILNNCSQYLQENENPDYYKLYRGVANRSHKKNVFKSAGIVTPRDNRNPKDTSEIVHNMITFAFKNSGFVANRDNSLFCTGSYSEAEGYSSLKTSKDSNNQFLSENFSVFVLYPIGNYNYTWSPTVRDFTSSFGNLGDLLQSGLKITNLDELFIKNFDEFWEILKRFLYDYDDHSIEEKLRMYKETEKEFIAAGHKLSIAKLIEYIPEKVKKENDERSIMNRIMSYYGGVTTFIHKFEKDMKHSQDLSFITDRYHTTDLIEAIKSRNEIMIKADRFFTVRVDYDKLLWSDNK